jgi:bifunctional UDP-N-acetylglucosamine pyrophosphorylase/glucosamine-1-phosphate N-acetyltransferase
MASGVTVIEPDRVWVGPEVRVARDTIIHPNVHLIGRTVIGKSVIIHTGCFIRDCRIEADVTLLPYSVMAESVVGRGARLGPFSHLRPGTVLDESVHIGNFVELKKAQLGARSKANHLTYLGDAVIGSGVNVGAGTITCNYDGINKHQTIIEDGVFIGSDTSLVAPVRVEQGAYLGAGSTITEDVPAGSLGIARGRQRNIEGWVERKKAERESHRAAKAPLRQKGRA